MRNAEKDVIEDFGAEWNRFDQSSLSEKELKTMFDNYFNIFPWEMVSNVSEGFDLGCGSGRWAKLVAPRVGKLHLIDPSSALEIAKRNLSAHKNVEFHEASVDEMPIEDCSQDFGYSLGVMHHVPDTFLGVKTCVEKLKPGCPFLLYLYYGFDNRPIWFRMIWKISDIVRRAICKMPRGIRYGISQLFAAFVYFPLARISLILEGAGINVDNLPLSQYRKLSFYTMRTDSLDRFGTRVEKRFTKAEMKTLMEDCGLFNITFSETSFWTAVGFKR